MPVPFPVYRPRNSQQTPYYRCVEDHLETLEQVYEDRFLGFNPHGHVLITAGCFPEKGLFVVAPTVKLK